MGFGIGDMRASGPNKYFLAVVFLVAFLLVYFIPSRGSPMGYASYRVRITGLKPGKVYSLLAPYQATAYALYLDRELVSSNGRVGESRADSAPGYYPRVVTFAAGGPMSS